MDRHRGPFSAKHEESETQSPSSRCIEAVIKAEGFAILGVATAASVVVVEVAVVVAAVAVVVVEVMS